MSAGRTLNFKLVVLIVIQNSCWGGGGGGTDDKFVIFVVKMDHSRCVHSARCITLGLPASCDDSWPLADIMPYTILSNNI